MKAKIDINLQHDQLSQSPVGSCRTYKICQGILNKYAIDKDHLKKSEIILMAYIQNNPDVQLAEAFDIAESIACMKMDKLNSLLSMYSAGNLMTVEIIQQFSSELDRKRRYLGRYFAHPMMQNRRAKRDDYKPSAVRVTQRYVP
ncbi:hypothetical protein [Piscirickettsia salmonis]|uniref:hypothetical protein n=1 Tax=Piscirickettsia salmonis TaxID=1238 RepID=UPI00050A0A60|nr:hypothetical protein [Piscirickettsia salmonis]QGN76354.1 hypothetical protein Psal001_00535 [Piscirickettsia salmonis]QGN79941.1 hypothetical protein Psal002_00557 [Piscirickettsia salmonis]QGN85784.1 hypothetical protein Psal003_02872 [Piscirickettsia salmonis]QGN89290.1 hypothetical protein Psal004_02864 [Piscirickettsia salmonis]QGN90543.1 hypothetical protein Psal005_00551 [Piscirickettsia salmonis]